ncbi:MAG TPA: hypothetical protein VGN42_16900 [Pirellulales bacterium]|nr:hypothetical protein [Pirellulales bacterium]
MESLEIAIATQRVRDYSDDVMQWHDEAMQALDCQDQLEKGIKAFDWLTRCEESILEAIRQGLIEPSERIDAAIVALYKAWLLPCDRAEAMIESQLGRGFEPGNLERFRDCCEQARDWLERRDWLQRTKPQDGNRFVSAT